MILLLIIGIFIPMFGAPDPHNLGRFAGPLIILAIFEIIAELILLNVLTSKPSRFSRSSLQRNEKAAVARKKTKKTNIK